MVVYNRLLLKVIRLLESDYQIPLFFLLTLFHDMLNSPRYYTRISQSTNPCLSHESLQWSRGSTGIVPV